MDNKMLGLVLIATAGLVILGLIVNNHILWLGIDVLVIVICSFAGVTLLTKK